MATKIRRCLYIGLGGSGMTTLLYTKKMLIDTYGEVPPMIGFLGIDTDRHQGNQKLESQRGTSVYLDNTEQLTITTTSATQIYNNNKSDFKWVPENNIFSLKTLDGNGQAGAVRSNGRFAFTVNISSIENAVQQKMNQILAANIINNKSYDVYDPTQEPDIHLVFSLGGGSGSGTFINMAALLRRLFPNANITGYAILPDVFDRMTNNGVQRVEHNTFGALCELDYIMHMDAGKRPITLSGLSSYSNCVMRTSPFNEVLFINNRNGNNNTITNVDDLSKMISLIFLTASAPLSAGQRLNANLQNNILNKLSTIGNKLAWAGGIGACEIVYPGTDLAEMYKKKTALQIISILTSQQKGTEAISEAAAWIDSNRIRETKGSDDVTDYIADKDFKYKFTLSADDYKPKDATVKPDIDHHISVNALKPQECQEKGKQLLEKAVREIHKSIITWINQHGGINRTVDILKALNAEINECLKEMREENTSLATVKSSLDTDIAKYITDIEDLRNKWFQDGNRKLLVNNLDQKTKEYIEITRDIERHKEAIVFYTSFQQILNGYIADITSISGKLETIKDTLNTDVSKLRNRIDEAAAKGIFQINIGVKEAMDMKVRDTDIKIGDFIDSLSGERVYDFRSKNVDEIKNDILRYTAKCNGTLYYQNKSVEDVLRNISKVDINEYNRILKDAIDKSSPLLRYNYGGKVPKQSATQDLFVAVYDDKNTILNNDGTTLQDVLKHNTYASVNYASLGMKDKIIFYSQLGVIPAYTIDGVDKYELQHKQQEDTCSAYIDEQLRNRMSDDNYSIYPSSRAKTNTDALKMWVMGCIYGLIKNEDGHYYIKSKTLGAITDGYWVKLASTRNDAFEYLCKHEKSISKEFDKHLSTHYDEQLIEDAKENYLDKYSQVRMTLDEIKLDNQLCQMINEEGACIQNFNK